MTGTAVVFPGQGSQHDRMRRLVAEHAPELAELAVSVVGADPFDHLDGGTRYVQPAVFCTSVASWRLLRREERPLAFAGHSLGEFAALVAAGVLDPEDGLRLVALRASLTQGVAERAGGGMVALLGIDGETVDELAGEWGVSVANDNCPGQVVISGEERALERALGALDRSRVRAVRLAVDGPFHSPLMREAVPEFEAALREAEFRPASAPVLSSITARPVSDPVRELAGALVSPVRWRETVIELDRLGVRRFVEAAPGQALGGLIKRTLRRAAVVAADRDHG